MKKELSEQGQTVLNHWQEQCRALKRSVEVLGRVARPLEPDEKKLQDHALIVAFYAMAGAYDLAWYVTLDHCAMLMQD